MLRRAWPIACFLLAATPTLATAQAPSLDQLLARFRAVQGMECRFREEKRDPILTTPIVTEGTVHYVPGRLARRTERPTPQVVLIEHGQVRMASRGRVESIDHPVARSFVDTFSLLFSGDLAALERLYRVDYQPGRGSTWTLVLVPRGVPLSEFLREIRFTGEGTTLATMVMTQSDGVVGTTTFTDVDVQRRYSADERARIFSLE